MCLLNKLIAFVLILCSSSIVLAQNDWSLVLKGKVESALRTVYETDQIKLEAIELEESVNEAAPANLNDHLFKVFDDNSFKGYAYVAQAPSMKNVFDYLVIFNKNLSIEKSKVLIYREQHGRQIGSVRWLSQFNGMTISDQPELGKEIDGISGATISARGMTVAINQLLASLSLAKEKGVL